MTKMGLKTFDSTVQETNHWLKLMMGELGFADRQSSFNALRAALHAIRDRIGVENAAHLGAQLPMLLRGAYYEGWRPALTPTRERHLEDFVDHVAAGLPRGDLTNPAEAARACLAVMERCVDSGEMVKLRRILPHEILNLMPDAVMRA
jgi:uncharacterized protein (DUF2267 family)